MYVNFNGKFSIFFCFFSLLILSFTKKIDGHSYERTAIQKWISDGNVTSPLTNEVLDSQILTPNYNLRSLIRKFRSTIPTIESND